MALRLASRTLVRACAALTVAGLALAAHSRADASPWGRDKGAVFLSSRADYFVAENETGDAAAAGPARFQRIESNTYAEAGLGWRTTIGGKVVYGSSTFFDGFESASASGFSEIELFAQRDVFRGDAGVFAVRIAGAAPSRREAGARAGLQSDGADVEARLLYGRTLAVRPLKIFATWEAGYRRRFGAGADQARADAGVGFEPTPRLLAMLQAFSTFSIGEAGPGGGAYDVVKLQPSLAWRFAGRWSLEAGLTHEAWGRNLLLGDTYFVGLWTAF